MGSILKILRPAHILLVPHLIELSFLLPHSGIKEWKLVSKQKLLEPLNSIAILSRPNAWQVQVPHGKVKKCFIFPSYSLLTGHGSMNKTIYTRRSVKTPRDAYLTSACTELHGQRLKARWKHVYTSPVV